MAKPSHKKQKNDCNDKTKVEIIAITNGNSNSNSNSNSTSNNNGDDDVKVCTTKRKRARQSLPRNSPSRRSSVYRGVTRHRWTGRFEAHLWDKDCFTNSKKKKGRQVYLGAYDDEEAAARAYDLAALKYWGKQTILNFRVSNYEKEFEEMEMISREEYIGSLRRKSSGFSRGVSKYRGVARHHHNGRWEARIGKVNGNKYLYLGTYATQEEAATAYDIAAIEHRGPNAVTNFDLSNYINLIKPNIINNNNKNINNSNLCDDQPSPIQFEPTKSIETSPSSTSSSPITSLSDHTFESVFDQLEENDICIDVDMLWSEQVSVDCPLELLGFGDYNSLQYHSTTDLKIGHVPCQISEGRSSSNNEFGSEEDGFFSELSSFLCDFDEV